jgi:hypothetical protein
MNAYSYSQLKEQYWGLLRPHKDQSALWRDDHRFICVVAGRGSGKTLIARRNVLRRAMQKKGIYFYTLPTIAQARRVGWNELREMAMTLGASYGSEVVGKPNESTMTIRLKNGSSVVVYGVEAPQRAEGLQYCGGVIDESSDTHPLVFTKSLIPALTAYSGWCWRIGVPKLDGIGGRDFQKSWAEWTSKGEQGDLDFNGYWWPSSTILKEEDLTLYRNTLDADAFNEQFEATWQNTRGSVFYCFDELLNIPQPGEFRYVHSKEDLNELLIKDPKNTKILVGMDFNVDPMCWVIGVCRRREDTLGLDIIIFDELWVRHTNTEACLTQLHQRLQKWGIQHTNTNQLVICGDAASRARHTNASLTDYLIIREHHLFKGCSIVFPKSNPSVKDRVSVTNIAFRAASGVRRLWIMPNCEHLIEDLNKRPYKEGTREIDDSTWGSGHITDALGYMVWSILRPSLFIKPESSNTNISHEKPNLSTSTYNRGTIARAIASQTLRNIGGLISPR